MAMRGGASLWTGVWVSIGAMSTVCSRLALMDPEKGARHRPFIGSIITAGVLIERIPIASRLLDALLFCFAAAPASFRRTSAGKRPADVSGGGAANHFTRSLALPAHAGLTYSMLPPGVLFTIFTGRPLASTNLAVWFTPGSGLA